ncbi:BsaA family SipW-dependent biofilm matrix protein [Ruminococcus sp.]|uniref:BsaA family SipW-dependent biofilm matrix protein n=1 Tax=Ruminococcus sp. TaxID=41978 RepID=UPI0025DADCED|nr:BsaA family SipW-dependent biofilm matrix protein [Ruminococcus sp.]
MKNDVSKKKTSKEKRVLIAALCIAASVVAGSTFAWFTSQDEVTNRLSASASYDVSIAEDFTPPENWVPGQTIDKNVGAVNTGNTDAFVRMWLEGEMRLIAQGTSSTMASSMSGATLNSVTDQQLLDANLTYKVGDVYLKELSTKTIQNPDTQNAASPTAYSEVMSVQAGGELAYVAPGSSYKFTANEAISVTNNKGAIQSIAKGKEYTVTVAATDNSVTVGDIVVDNTANTITLQNLAAFRNIDSNTFVPASDGLYLFRRNVNMVNGSPTGGTGSDKDDYEFSGYYVKEIGGTKHYFALEYDNTGAQRSDYVLPDSVVTVTLGADNNYTVANNGIKMFTASQQTIENSNLVWKYIDTNTTVTPYTNKTTGAVVYKVGDSVYDSIGAFVAGDVSTVVASGDLIPANYDTGTAITYSAHCMLVAKDNIVINVALSNIGTDAEKWTAKTATGNNTTFYYNNDLEEGATTAQLVNSLTLDPSVTQNDYIAFDFDLNVFMDSVQVTVAENGDEGFASVSDWAAGTGNVGATGAAGTVTNGEIELIVWS